MSKHVLGTDRNGVVHIGDAHGKVAIYCDETFANDIMAWLGPRDGFTKEIAQAIEAAYPEDAR